MPESVWDEIIGDDYKDTVDLISNKISKDYGFDLENIESVSHDKKKIIPVSPLFDLKLGGGIPEGSTVLLSGQAKAGKTSLALQIALGGQLLDGRPTFYFDIEGRFKEMNLYTVKGLNPKGVKLIRSKKGKIISGDEHLNMAYDVITNVPGAIVILDSTSQICSSGELEESISGNIRSSGPKLMSFFTKKISSVLCVQNATVIMIQHIIADTGRSMKTKAISGGNKIQYQADVNIECAYTQDWEEPAGTLVGKKSYWQVVTSALGPPTGKFEAYLRFGVGYDKTTELINLGKDIGLISGANYTTFDYLYAELENDAKIKKFAEEKGVDFTKLDTKTHQKNLESAFKVRGGKSTYEFLEDNPYFAEILAKKIKEAFN